MLLSVAGDLLLFSVTGLGWGMFFATWIRGFSPLDRLSLGLAGAVVGCYLASFACYWLHLPPAALWLFVFTGCAAVLRRRGAIGELGRDGTLQGALRHWATLVGWCLGWQALVISYSGGGWSGDWQEHYDRAHFFLQHWPTDHLFNGLYPLPARPPLANLVVGGFLGLVGGAFFHFQVFSTLLATLVYFPLAGLVQKLRPGAHPQALLLGLLMLSPLLVQNATFPWTKLPAAFFIVLAVGLLTRPPLTETARALTFVLVALAAALLTHYSAAPWILAGGVAWVAVNRALWSSSAHRRGLLLGAAAGTMLFMTWLGWSLATYGASFTFTANSSTGLAAVTTLAERASHTLGNLYRTLVPAWLWEGMPPLLQQSSWLARLRDQWFCLYQLNLPFAFGFGGFAALVRLLLARARSRDPEFRFWRLAGPLVIVITAAVAPPDALGLTHIILQPLVLLGLAWLAASAHTLPAFWTRLWVAGLAVDFIFGLVLQFGVQSLWLDRWLNPGHREIDHIIQLSQPAAANYYGKLRIGAVHLAAGVPPAVALLLLGASAVWALAALRSSAPARQP